MVLALGLSACAAGITAAPIADSAAIDITETTVATAAEVTTDLTTTATAAAATTATAEATTTTAPATTSTTTSATTSTTAAATTAETTTTTTTAADSTTAAATTSFATTEFAAPDPTPEDWDARFARDAAQFAELYPVTDSSPYVFATFDELILHLEYGTGVIAFGFPACPRCQNAFPVLEKAFSEKDMTKYAGFHGKIMYYNILDDREADNERYKTIVGFLKDNLQLDDGGNPRIFVPDIFFIASGKVAGNHLDTVASVTDPFDPLTEAQADELLEIYKSLIDKIEDCGC